MAVSRSSAVSAAQFAFARSLLTIFTTSASRAALPVGAVVGLGAGAGVSPTGLTGDLMVT